MDKSENKGIVITDEIAENITKVEELAYELKINQVMTSTPQVIQPDNSMDKVSDLFREKRISGAPVVKAGAWSEFSVLRILSGA